MSDTLMELPYCQVSGLLEKLEGKWPDNIAIYHTIRIGLDWIRMGSEMNFHIFVPTGSRNGESVVVVQDRPTAYRVLLHCPEQSEDALLDAMFESQRISWTRTPEFCRIPQRIARKLTMRLAEKGVKHDVEEDVYFWLPAKRAISELPLVSPPDDFELHPLEEGDLNVMCENYPLLSAGTWSLSKDIILFSKTVGLYTRDTRRLISWAVLAQWGSIGQVMVLPDYRGRGLAKVVVSHMAHVIAEQGLDPYCNISKDNHASLGLFKGLGFVPFGTNCYLICKASN